MTVGSVQWLTSEILKKQGVRFASPVIGELSSSSPFASTIAHGTISIDPH